MLFSSYGGMIITLSRRTVTSAEVLGHFRHQPLEESSSFWTVPSKKCIPANTSWIMRGPVSNPSIVSTEYKSKLLMNVVSRKHTHQYKCFFKATRDSERDGSMYCLSWADLTALILYFPVEDCTESFFGIIFGDFLSPGCPSTLNPPILSHEHTSSVLNIYFNHTSRPKRYTHAVLHLTYR